MLTSLLWIVGAWSAEIPGTGISLEPPPGFEAQEAFAGFGDPATQATVLVTAFPAEAWGELRGTVFGDKATAAAEWAKRGVVVKQAVDLTTAGGLEVRLFAGSQVVEGERWSKWVGLVHGPQTVLVTVQAPPSAKLKSAAVRAVLESVEVEPPPGLDAQVAELPFAVDVPDGWTLRGTLAGSALAITKGEGDEAPMIVVASQVGAGSGQGIAETAEALLRTTRELGSPTIDRTTAGPFAGAEGVCLGGTATLPSGAAARFVQWLSVGPDGRYVRLVAFGPAAGWADVEAAVEAAAATVRWRAGRTP